MSEQAYRLEHDSMGELKVPADALWGAQTQRAVQNFRISGLRLPRAFIQALGLIKASAAAVNRELGLLDAARAQAVEIAAVAVAEGKFDAQFPVDVFQTGSGTSSNMNANEVIAHLATAAGAGNVHPNDHVNMSQSSNDVVPTAIHVSAALTVTLALLPALRHLAEAIESRARDTDQIVKIGRTHLMDAMPIRMSQELSGWASQIRNGYDRVETVMPRLLALAQGGTAVGTGINAHPEFGVRFARDLGRRTGIAFRASDNYFEALSCQDTSVELSGQLKTLAVSFMKISNDLRWMNSGPLAGLGEITLPELQPGSSIMPGKVNPVIAEAVTMGAAQVIGNDATITVAGQAGNFQLNVMLPVIAYNLLQSIDLLANSARGLADDAITGFAVNKDRLKESLANNPMLITALNSVIGYEQGAAIAKRAYREHRPILDVAKEMTDLSEARLRDLLNPAQLTGSFPKK